MKHTDLAASIFLLGHDPATGRAVAGRVAACAAVLIGQLADLMIAGRVRMDGEHVVVTGRRSPGTADPTAELVVETLAFQGADRSVRDWADGLGDAVYTRVADGLVDAGLLRCEQPRRLLGVAERRYPPIDGWRAARPRLELEHMIRAPRAFDLPGAVAVAVLADIDVFGLRPGLRDELVAQLPAGLQVLVDGSAGPGEPDDGVFAGSRLLVECAAMRSRRAGPAHDALRARNAAAAELVRARRPQDAIPLLEQVVADAGFRLGPHHPDTLLAEGNLAVAYLGAERADVGVPLLVATLADRERVLGEEHPATLTAREVLAAVHRTAGRPAEALAHYVQVVAQRTRVLGPGHPDTLVSRLGLALSRADSGDARTATAVLSGAVRDATAGCGPGHLVTVALRGALADCLAASGQTAAAAAEYDRAAHDADVGLGSAHPDAVALRAARAALDPPPPVLSNR